MEQSPEKREIERTVFISFNAGIDQNTAQTLVALLVQQIQAGFNHLYIMFSTSGGNVSDGMTLYNTIRALPATVTMHNMGNVDSIGSTVYLAGHKRYACKHSTFMFHGVYQRFNEGNMTEGPLVEALSSIRADQKRMADIIADACIVDDTPLPSVDIQSLFANSETKDADFAVKIGMAHAIRDVHIPDGAVVIPLVFPPLSS
jgi:ATP-dependent protease ClpP protease subunit